MDSKPFCRSFFLIRACRSAVFHISANITAQRQKVLYTQEKEKVIAHDFQSPDDNILTLQVSIENIGLAKRSPQDISRLDRETASLADSTVLDTDTGVINGFPSNNTVYRHRFSGKI